MENQKQGIKEKTNKPYDIADDKYYITENGTIFKYSDCMYYDLDEDLNWKKNGYWFFYFYRTTSEFKEISPGEVDEKIRKKKELRRFLSEDKPGEILGRADLTGTFMTGQLVALYKYYRDEIYHKQYLDCLTAIGLTWGEAETMFVYECILLRDLARDLMCRNNYLQWNYFSRGSFFLPLTIKDYIRKPTLLCSEMMKIASEAEWIYQYWGNKELSGRVWNEIKQISGHVSEECSYHAYIRALAELVGIDVEKVQIYADHELKLLSENKWNLDKYREAARNREMEKQRSETCNSKRTGTDLKQLQVNKAQEKTERARRERSELKAETCNSKRTSSDLKQLQANKAQEKIEEAKRERGEWQKRLNCPPYDQHELDPALGRDSSLYYAAIHYDGSKDYQCGTWTVLDDNADLYEIIVKVLTSLEEAPRRYLLPFHIRVRSAQMMDGLGEHKTEIFERCRTLNVRIVIGLEEPCEYHDFVSGNNYKVEDGNSWPGSADDAATYCELVLRCLSDGAV